MQVLNKVLGADGLTYIIVKAIRDFVMVYAVAIGADTFTATPDSLKAAAIAAASTTIYRAIREVITRFEIVQEDA